MYFLDLTEETEIIELIEELKTKQVKYPRKGKGVRRKRSNTSKLVSRFHLKLESNLVLKISVFVVHLSRERVSMRSQCYLMQTLKLKEQRCFCNYKTL
jgi:hypothetical protein